MAATKTFKYVYVPCDAGAEVEERVLAVPPGQEIECLTKHLQASASLNLGQPFDLWRTLLPR